MSILPSPSKTRADATPLSRRTMLILAGGAFLLMLIVWQTGTLDGLLYPMRLFVSLIHELGHGLTAILTGGQFLGFEVFPNGAGLAHMRGGSPFLTPQMGYLGAGLCGAILLALTNRTADVRWVAYGLAALIGGCVLLFTGASGILIPLIVVSGGAWLAASRIARYRTPLRILAGMCILIALAVAWTDTTLRIGLIGAALLALLAAFGSRPLIVFVMNFLALIIGLNAIMDIWLLFGDLGASVNGYPNDAAAMARITGLPTIFWVLLWVALVVLMMGAAAYVAFVQPLRRAR